MWDLLVQEGVVERGVHGYIPAFVGAATAADRLAGLPEWRAAQVVKAVPDRAQQPVRERALRDGKLLYVAVPRLAAGLPFYALDPASLTAVPAEAASKEHAAHHARKVGVADMRRVDMVVCGSVAVSRRGTRLGKGASSEWAVTLCCRSRAAATACARHARAARTAGRVLVPRLLAAGEVAGPGGCRFEVICLVWR